MSYTDQYSPLPTAPRTRRMSPQLGNGTALAVGGGVSSPGQIGMMHPGLLAPSAPMSYSGGPQTMAAPIGPSLQQQNLGISPRGPSPNSSAGMAQAGIQYPGLAMRQASQAYGRANVAMSAPAPRLSSPGGTASAILPGGGTLSHTYSPTMRPQGEVDQVMHDRQAYADRQNMAGDMAMMPSTGSPSFSADRSMRLAGAAAAPGMYAAETSAIQQAPQAAADAAMMKQLPAFLNAGTNATKAQNGQSNADRDYELKKSTTPTTQSSEQLARDKLKQEKELAAGKTKVEEDRIGAQKANAAGKNPNQHLIDILQHARNSITGKFDPAEAQSMLQFYQQNATGLAGAAQPQQAAPQQQGYQPSVQQPVAQPAAAQIPKEAMDAAAAVGGQVDQATGRMAKDGWEYQIQGNSWVPVGRRSQ